MAHSVLVVEDNPDNRKLVTWILEDEGYAITCAETGEKALDLLRSSRFDIILMDISLPGMDGTEATRAIRLMPENAKLPIIALTAHAVKGELEPILASGVDDVITKPLDEDLLLTRMQELLNP